MSRVRRVLLGAVAIALTLGAVQFASGQDLVNRWQTASGQAGQIVNRAGKTDRIADRKPSAVPTTTVSVRLNDLANTSVSLRIASAQARNTRPATPLGKQSRKTPVACEPMVSALTEVAKLLGPGRCVT